MGQHEEALRLADFLIRKLGLTVDRISLGYAVMEWCDDEDRKEQEESRNGR